MSAAWSVAVDLLDLVRGLAISLGILAMSVTLLRSRPAPGQLWNWLETAVTRGVLVMFGSFLGFGLCLYGQLNGLTASPAPAVETDDCQRLRTDYANLLDSLGNEPKPAKRGG